MRTEVLYMSQRPPHPSPTTPQRHKNCGQNVRMCGEKTFGQLISLRPGRILCPRGREREVWGEG